MPHRKVPHPVESVLVSNPAIMLLCQLQSRHTIGRQQPKEILQQLELILKVRGELPQKWSQLFPQQQDSGGHKICQRRLDLAQPADVRNEARPFHGKNEIFRGVFLPP